MRRLLEGTTRTAGYARMLVDRGDGRTILKPPRALAAGEDMATYLLCDRGFVPTITTVVPADLAKATLYHENLREAEDTDFAIRLALTGCAFVMAEAPGAVWCDHYDPNRQSAARSSARLAAWLDAMKFPYSAQGLARRPRLGGGEGRRAASSPARPGLLSERAGPWLLSARTRGHHIPPDLPARPPLSRARRQCDRPAAHRPAAREGRAHRDSDPTPC